LYRRIVADPKQRPALEALLSRMDPASAELRAFGLRLLEGTGEDISELRSSIVKRGEKSVVTYVALGGSLGKPPKLQAEVDLVSLTKEDQPGEIRYAATRQLDPRNQRERLIELIADPDPFIQQAAR